MSKHVGEKCGKLCISSILSSKRGLTPTKKWTEIEDTQTRSLVQKTKPWEKFQPNKAKHVQENCGKLRISSILSSKRGITPTKIDGNK